MLDIVFKSGLNIKLTNILEPIVRNLEISKNGVLRHWITVAMVTHHYTTQLPLTFFHILPQWCSPESFNKICDYACPYMVDGYRELLLKFSNLLWPKTVTLVSSV